MKHFLPIMLPLLCCSTAFTQVTITSTDFASQGDQYVFYTDTLFTISLGSTGSGQTWDFGVFTPDLVDTLNVVDPAGTPDGAQYPNANLAIQNATGYAYLNKTSGSIKTEGFSGSLQGFANAAVVFTPPQTILQFPASMGTNFNSNSGFVSPGIPFGFNIQCGLGSVNIDSARVHHSSQLNVNFDAEGNLGIPTGTYNVVRSLSTDKTADTIYIYVDGPCILLGLTQGWQKAPNQLMQFAGFPGNPIEDTLYTYDFWSENEIYSVCSVILDEAGNPGTANYNADAPVGLEDAGNTSFSVYPNPSSDVVYINTNGETGFDYAVYDLNGKLYFKGALKPSAGIDLSGLPAGQYILKLEKPGKLHGTVHLTKN